MTVAPASPLWTCAREALTLAVRSRQLQIFALVFGALALLVAASGYVLTAAPACRTSRVRPPPSSSSSCSSSRWPLW